MPSVAQYAPAREKASTSPTSSPGRGSCLASTSLTVHSEPQMFQGSTGRSPGAARPRPSTRHGGSCMAIDLP